jgi:hypothetical protein
MRTGTAIGLAGLVAIAPVQAETHIAFPATHDFFPAVKRGDIAAAKAMIDGEVIVAEWERDRLRRTSFTPAQFFDRVKSCRYDNGFVMKDDPDVEFGVWLCPLRRSRVNPNRSKTIMVQANFKGERVTLESYNEQESTIPAVAKGS